MVAGAASRCRRHAGEAQMTAQILTLTFIALCGLIEYIPVRMGKT
jgi:hypothetical protein